MSRLLSRRSLVVIGVTAGIALFVEALRVADPATVASGLRRVGAGFAWILLIAGGRLVLRAAAWSACAGGTSRLSFSKALEACLIGEAAGSLTPLGPAASEPLKVACVRRQLETVEAGASLAVENLFYSVSVAAMLVAGGLAALTVVAPAAAKWALLASAAAVIVGFAWAQRPFRSTRPASSSALQRLAGRVQHFSSGLDAVAEGLRRTEAILRSLASARPWTLVFISVLEVAFQALSVIEVWVTLMLLGVDVGLVNAFLMDTANRAVSVAFKFVPLRMGVDEWASGAMASAIGGSGSIGVTVAVIRKARVLVVSLLGMLMGLRCGLRAAPAQQRQSWSSNRAGCRRSQSNVAHRDGTTGQCLFDLTPRTLGGPVGGTVAAPLAVDHRQSPRC
jgi:hypothetical protein